MENNALVKKNNYRFYDSSDDPNYLMNLADEIINASNDKPNDSFQIVKYDKIYHMQYKVILTVPIEFFTSEQICEEINQPILDDSISSLEDEKILSFVPTLPVAS